MGMDMGMGMDIIPRHHHLNDGPFETGPTAELTREIGGELQNLTAMPDERRMSVNKWLAIDPIEERGEFLSRLYKCGKISFLQCT